MDARTLQAFVLDHPEGVRFRMIDRTQYDVPHRDSIWFTPAYGKATERVGRYSTSLWIHEIAEDRASLVNALLVADALPWLCNGNGHSEGSDGNQWHGTRAMSREGSMSVCPPVVHRRRGERDGRVRPRINDHNSALNNPPYLAGRATA